MFFLVGDLHKDVWEVELSSLLLCYKLKSIVTAVCDIIYCYPAKLKCFLSSIILVFKTVVFMKIILFILTI
jgi:hypothetical protein